MFNIKTRITTPVPLRQTAWTDDIVFLSETTTTTTTLHTTVPSSTHGDDSILLSVSTPQASRREGMDLLATFLAVWGVVVVMLALAVVTVVANGTILTMFVLRKSLRRCKNIYIVSLAAADMGIGFTVPLAALEQVETNWVLEGLACRSYLTLRCSLLYVSLLSILLITVDRWWSIHYPFSYRVRQSKRMACCAVGIVWAACFAINILPVLLWEHLAGPALQVKVKDMQAGVAAFPEALMSPTSSSSSSFSSFVLSQSSGVHSALTLDSSPLLSSPVPPSLSPSSLMAVLTTMTSSDIERQAPVHSDDVRYFHSSQQQREERSEGQSGPHWLNTGRHCELPYVNHFSFVLTVCVVQYFLPLLSLWILNSSLYFKITRRKAIKIRRSLSVNDNYLLKFRKSSSESESSPNGQDDSYAVDLGVRSVEQRQRLLAVSRASTRRHTLAFPGTPIRSAPGAFGNGGLGTVYFPSQSIYRQAHLNRRVSLQDALPGIGSMAAWAGAVPNLPRVTTCHRLFGSSGGLSGTSGGLSGVAGRLAPMGMWFGSGPRASVCSTRRKQSDDLVKEMLVRQDKKAARCLGLLVTIFTLCWLPHTVVALLRAHYLDLVAGWVRDLVFWVLLLNSAVNPFLYGLLNAEFRKILRAWFYVRRRTKFRLKHALLYWSLPPQIDSDPAKENNPLGLFAAPIRE